MAIFVNELGYDITDLGYDKLITKEDFLSLASLETTPELANVFTSGVAPKSLTGGELIEDVNMVSGFLQSSNFESGSAGWQLTPTSAEFNIDASFAGELTAASGTLGALTIASGGHIKQGQTDYATGTGFWMGDDGGTPKFSIGKTSDNSFLKFDGESVTISNLKFENYIAGSIPIASAPNEVWTNNTNYVRVKELYLSITGVVKVRLFLKSSDGSNAASYRITKDGNSQTSGSTTSTTYTEFDPTISGISPGEILEIDIKGSGGHYAYIKTVTLSVGVPPFPTSLPILDSANEV